MCVGGHTLGKPAKTSRERHNRAGWPERAPTLVELTLNSFLADTNIHKRQLTNVEGERVRPNASDTFGEEIQNKLDQISLEMAEIAGTVSAITQFVHDQQSLFGHVQELVQVLV